MADEDLRNALLHPGDPLELRTGLSRNLWRLGVLNGALLVFLVGLAVAAFVVRDRDLERQIAANQAQIAYICENTSLFDVLVVQEKAALGLQLATERMGPNERERIRSRRATLEVIHREFSDQRRCEEVQ